MYNDNTKIALIIFDIFYNKIINIKSWGFGVLGLQLQLEEALKKFVKDWKTIDNSKINYLMKYGIVQEVMKIEERKAEEKTKKETNAGMDLDGETEE